MFKNSKISRRLIVLISALTLTIVSIGGVTLVGMTGMVADTKILNVKTAEAAAFSRIAGSVRYHMLDVAQELSAGTLEWTQAERLLEAGSEEFERLWQAQQTVIASDPKNKEFFDDTFGLEIELVRQGYTELSQLVAVRDIDRLLVWVINDLHGFTDPFLNSADALSNLSSIEAAAIYAESERLANVYLMAVALAILIGLLAATILGTGVYSSISGPIAVISDAVKRVAAGDIEARTGLETSDELGELANTFDNMLDERVSSMARVSEDNENLNNSVIMLLEAVSDLSDRDLTVRVPIAEDVTGPVADAMNMLTTETARVLGQIRRISNQVAEAALTVESQGGKINQLADEERVIIEDTMSKLDEASKAMVLIARQAKISNDIAAKATASTEEALQTVTRTTQGMNEIRETIAETEKRIKRLGERSQEINSVVEIINNIAERTHILSLNASMQAAAAGDAGRGFAVVANEVQRLAESSRDSTSEIAGLINNIQVETAETMAAMNKAIAQVVEGSELAQASGVKMQVTQETTAELVHAVEQIAKRSMMQAQFSKVLRTKTEEAQRSTEETNTEIKLQAAQATNLLQFSQQLLESVNVFKLPEAS
ncbi:MAG: HAMP domain-containing protein [Gammaproteobacteria bacterium]|jgi:methyl-accepting chemotaxis protein|nr:HAMP domain-containing protein [Gammaproteobacteria bacterium]